MLTDLTKAIEKGLMSYLKGLEGSALHNQFDRGLSVIMTQCRHLTAERKADICMLYNICQEAEKDGQEPDVCVKHIVDYLNNMSTGFLFFRGQSKLKNCIIHAIDVYDPRYILDNTTHPIQLDPQAQQRPLQPQLIPNQGGRTAVEMQYQLDEMKAIAMQHAFNIKEIQASLKEAVDEREQKNQHISMLEAEVIALRGQLAGLNGAPQPGSAKRTGSMHDDDQHASRRASFSH